MLMTSRSILNRRTVAIGAGCTLLLCGAVAARAEAPAAPTSAVLHDPREVHLADIRQLTSGGENAEAYWAEDGLKLSFQSTRPPYACDQIFSLPADREITEKGARFRSFHDNSRRLLSPETSIATHGSGSGPCSSTSTATCAARWLTP